MATSIESLPYELLSAILQQATELNEQDNVNFPLYTYGLTRTSHNPTTQPELHVRGELPPDIRRWKFTAEIRKVSRLWREWGLDYAVRDVYVRRWRGSERWLDSNALASKKPPFSSTAVYRDSFTSLKSTAAFFSASPFLAAHVRRIWFSGFYVAGSNSYIFAILRHCQNLRSVTLPWTALRHGTVESWTRLLNSKTVSSLELLAVDLKDAQKAEAEDCEDNRILENLNVDFSGLERLKLFGNTNFKPVCDDDLRLLARTATNLREIHITGMSSISIEGVLALVLASSKTLRILEYSPLTSNGFEHPDPAASKCTRHTCSVLLNCRRLQDLSISVPALCPKIFSDSEVNWSGDLQIRAGGLCGDQKLTSEEGHATFFRVLEAGRELINSQAQKEIQLDIEIYVGNWLFEPRKRLVHGDIGPAEISSEFGWPQPPLQVSNKGPYGQTGLYGKDEVEQYSYVSEESFFDGVRQGVVAF